MDVKRFRYLYGSSSAGSQDAVSWKSRFEQCVTDALIKKLDKSKSTGLMDHLREYFLEGDWRRLKSLGCNMARVELLFRVILDNAKRAVAIQIKRREKKKKKAASASIVEAEYEQEGSSSADASSVPYKVIECVPDIEDLSNFIVYEVVDPSIEIIEEHVEVQTTEVNDNRTAQSRGPKRRYSITYYV